MPEPVSVCFDSLSEAFAVPVGAVAAGHEVRLRVRLPKRSGAHAPRLLVYAADRWEEPILIQPMTLSADEPTAVWYQTRFVPPRPQLLFYRFDAEVGEGRERRPIMKKDGLGLLDAFDGTHWQLTVYDPHRKTPPALAGGLIYQIFPDRFYRSGIRHEKVPADRILRDDWGGEPNWRPDENGAFRCDDYFGGDLAGIREKLPYLEELGVTALYLNPIFEAHSNHRYNTANYEKIDPLLGTDADFSALCADARARGIVILLDGVFSHTGSDSVYMNREGRYGEKVGAARDPDSPYRPWFSFEEYPDQYKSWWGFVSLPEVRKTEPSYLDYMAGEGGIIDRWMKAGASGWRLDVADELPDAALDVLCAAMRRHDPDAPIIGEVWEDASNKTAYGVRRRYLLGDQLSSVMNYPLTDAILAFVRDGDAYSLFYTLLTQMENYPPPVLHALMNSLSTHDIERAVTRLAGPSCAGAGRDWQQAHNALTPVQLAHGKTLLRLASVLQYTLPGVPCLYYGDEAGMFGYKDPFNRGCYPWGDEDPALVEFFCMLGKLRKRVPCLADGGFSLVRMSSDIFAFVRRGAHESLYVAVNRSAVPCTPPLPPELRPDEGELLLGDPNRLVLAATDAMILRYPTAFAQSDGDPYRR